MYVCLLCVVR